MADFAGPGLVEGGDAGEEGGDGEDAAGDLAGGFAGGVKGHAEENDDQQGEKEHGIDGFAGSPFDAQVFAQVSQDQGRPVGFRGIGRGWVGHGMYSGYMAMGGIKRERLGRESNDPGMDQLLPYISDGGEI